jgi:hypothetical protein
MTKKRENSIDINKEEFHKIGYQLIDTISNFFDEISEKPVTTSKSPKELQKILYELQKGGEMFLSNIVILTKYCLRVCIVNFRTEKKDIEACAEIIAKEGRKIHLILLDKQHSKKIKSYY